MQRPEAWPRPHPGEGAAVEAAAAARGVTAQGAGATEPPGLRVRCALGSVRNCDQLTTFPALGAAAAAARAQLQELSATTLQEPSLYTVKAVFILDNDGHRLLAKYYDDTFPSIKEQKAFEKNVFNKTNRTDSEIAFFGGMTIVYKSSIDLFLYVVGSSQENELMLMSVLTCLFDSLNHVLRRNIEKHSFVENMDGAFLVVDEIVDGGVILENDPQQVIQKVNFRVDDSSLSEQSVAQVLQSAKEQIKWSLLK
ncbi:coatomer subunit zeta-2 isoform X3 [Petaurus breviceps papuanus]|uniref:coatomer subunit zeta-2 isoform X3 n=1 Tax=Petaurus breviceps papuanus TaxID=3040969 RepID=UPI0036DDFEE3